jgi:hypothetical protein
MGYGKQSQRKEQSYEEFEDERRLYAKLGLKTPDGLGFGLSDYLMSSSSSSQQHFQHQLNQQYQQQQQQKNAAVVAGAPPPEEEEEEVKQIAGSVPIRELLGEGEEKLLHVALTEDVENSYTKYASDGSSIVHTVFKPYPCGRKNCGICYGSTSGTSSSSDNNNSNIQKQKVASSSGASSNNNSSVISSSSSSNKFGSAHRKLAFEEIEDSFSGIGNQ